MNEQPCNVLGSLLGKELTADESRLLDTLGTVRELADGDLLIKEDEIDHSLHVVLGGNIAVTRQVAGGDWVTLHVLHRCDLAGELGFIDGVGHSASLRALGPARVFSLPRTNFDPLLESHPHLVFSVMRAIIRGVHATLRRMNLQQTELSNYISHQHGRY